MHAVRLIVLSRGFAYSGSIVPRPSRPSMFPAATSKRWSCAAQNHVESDDPTDYKEDPEDPSSDVGTARLCTAHSVVRARNAHLFTV